MHEGTATGRQVRFGWNSVRTSQGAAVGRAIAGAGRAIAGAGRDRVALGGATAGAATVARAGVRTMGAATAGCTRPERLTGTTRLALGLGPRPRSTMDGGAGGATRATVGARYVGAT